MNAFQLQSSSSDEGSTLCCVSPKLCGSSICFCTFAAVENESTHKVYASFAAKYCILTSFLNRSTEALLLRSYTFSRGISYPLLVKKNCCLLGKPCGFEMLEIIAQEYTFLQRFDTNSLSNGAGRCFKFPVRHTVEIHIQVVMGGKDLLCIVSSFPTVQDVCILHRSQK